MREDEPGADKHVWSTRYAALEDDLASEPTEALPDLLDLVEAMLSAAGYDLTTDAPTEDPAVTASVARARELVERTEAGEDVRPDDALQAASSLRELYRTLLDEPTAEAGPDMRETGT